MEARDLDYSSDIILLTAITPSRPIADPRRAAALQLKLRGLRDPSLLPVSRRQSGRRAGPDSYYLRIELPEDDPRDSRTIPRPEPDLEPYLKPTLNIQSNHPSIQSLARQIVGTEKNARRVTAKLVNWVYHNLDKSFLAAIPDALRVLEKKAGDCKAHSILFVALARSLGIPARIASGLVYTPDGKFYYHQWAEVYLDRWRAVDPVFGQIQADATHITLSYGELSEQIRLMNLIGQLEIEILDYD
jgi:transglutaminase-like putative cysteine protease